MSGTVILYHPGNGSKVVIGIERQAELLDAGWTREPKPGDCEKIDSVTEETRKAVELKLNNGLKDEAVKVLALPFPSTLKDVYQAMAEKLGLAFNEDTTKKDLVLSIKTWVETA